LHRPDERLCYALLIRVGRQQSVDESCIKAGDIRRRLRSFVRSFADSVRHSSSTHLDQPHSRWLFRPK